MFPRRSINIIMNQLRTPTGTITLEVIRVIIMRDTTPTLTIGAVQCHQQCQRGHQGQPLQATPSDLTVVLNTDQLPPPGHSIPPAALTQEETLLCPVGAPAGPAPLMTDRECRIITRRRNISGVPPSDCMTSLHQMSQEGRAEQAPPGPAELRHLRQEMTILIIF